MIASSDPDIDVVIAVHATARPLQRAIQSCREEPDGPSVRVTVVCHNITIEEIKRNLEPVTGLELRFLHLADGRNSPAGPKNVGLDAATGAYVCMLDSDDYLEPGALVLWHHKLVSEKADVVIAPVRHESGEIIKTPRARTCRASALDPVKDGLSYATAMRGLWKSGIGAAGGIRYTSGLRTGEDLAPGLQVYFSGAKILFPRHGPAYVLGNDAEDRVTGGLLPLSEEFRAILALPADWLQSLSIRQRMSIASKIARTSLIGAIRRRGTEYGWGPEDLAAVQDVAEFLEGMSPGYRRVVTVADANLLESSLRAGSGRGLFLIAIESHQHAGRPSRVFTRKLQDNLNPESQLRQLFRVVVDRRS